MGGQSLPKAERIISLKGPVQECAGGVVQRVEGLFGSRKSGRGQGCQEIIANSYIVLIMCQALF